MSVEFNGTTSIVGAPVSATLRPTLPVTIAMWVVPDTLKACGFFQNNRDSGTFRGCWLNSNSTSGDLDCGYGDNGGGTSADRRNKVTVSPNFLTVDVWQHIAASIRGATDMTIYLNGADVGGNYSGTGAGMGYNAGIGGRIGSGGGTPNFDGYMEDLGFWNVSLSTAEILSMAKGVPAKMVRPASLLLNYPFWDATSPNIDLSANSLESSSLTAITIASQGAVGCPYPPAV